MTWTTTAVSTVNRMASTRLSHRKGRLRRASRGASKGLDASAQPAEHRVGLAAPSTREFDGLGRRRGHHSARGKLDRQQMNGGDNGGFDRGG